MTTRQVPHAALLGFLAFEKTTKKDGFIAALMVTDERGYPMEFRATTPVRPSLVQRTLYGSQLEHYVAIELCAKPLVQQSQRKPRTVLVPEPWLLDIAEESKVNVAAIWHAGEVIRVEEKAPPSATGTIRPTGSTYQPVVYRGNFMNPDQERETLALLEICAARFDLVEVFQRMRSALEILAKEDPRYA